MSFKKWLDQSVSTKKFKFVACVCAFTLAFCATNIWQALMASTYYVDTVAGSDANSCGAAQTIGTAKKTIIAAIGCLSGGDTLNVRAGTYNEGELANIIPSGLGFPTGATTIQKNPGDATPEMRGSLWISVKANILWDGININGINNGTPVADGNQEQYSDVYINGGTNIKITNAELSNCKKNCILTSDANGPLNGLYFTNLKVHGGGSGGYTSVAEPSDHNFFITASNTVTGTILIDHVESYGAVFAPNSWGVTIYSSSSSPVLSGVVVSNSYIHDNSEGISVGSGPNHKVFQNIIFNNASAGSSCEGAITVGYGVGMSNIQIYANAIVGNQACGSAYAVTVGTFGSPANTQIKNNIFWQNNHDSVLLAGGSGTIQSNNFFGSDPLFVNPGIDFHLQSGSSARNFGANLTSAGITVDKDGNVRPASGNWDDGPYQATGGGGGGGAPAAPTGLVVPVSLIWGASAGPNLAGYNIYRSTTAGVFTTHLNGAAITQTFYTDNSVVSGNTYYYIVRAVNTSAVESANSNQITVVR